MTTIERHKKAKCLFLNPFWPIKIQNVTSSTSKVNTMDYINVHQYLNHWIAITFLEVIYLRDWSAFYSDSWTNTFYLPKLTLICFSLKVPGITCLLIMKTLWSTFDDTWSVHSTCHKAVPGVDGHVPCHFVQLLVKTENAPDEGKQDDVVKVHTVLKQWVLFDP